MKKLTLQNPAYRYLEESFKEWLDILGYAPTTVYNLPIHIRELLHYLESQGVQNIRSLAPAHLEAHYENLKTRSNQRRGGGLSGAHLNKHQQAIGKFTAYLRQVRQQDLKVHHLHHETTSPTMTSLSQAEISQLYEATYQNKPHPK
ncbi:hypothetical protein JMN32_15075, partial [Fulvivirga sp. 29W222]